MRFAFFVPALIVSIFFHSVVAVAGPSCPRWDGHYTCEYNGGFGHHVFEMDMKTIDERGQAVYVANGEKVYPDGKPHHTDHLPILERWADNVDYIANCVSGDRINITGQATVKKNGQRAQLDGYMLNQGSGQVGVIFNVKVGFFNLNFNVPCVKR